MPDHRERTAWIVIGAVAAAAVALAVVIVALLLDGDDTTEVGPTTTGAPSSSTTTTRPGASGPSADVDVEDVMMQEGIIQRHYLVISPKDVDEDERLPVVMVLHGLGFDRHAIAAAAEWDDAVEDDRFIAVFPQGVLNSWNAGPCCPPASLTGVDDVAFLDRVVAQLEERPDVDPKRIYLTGYSNGGIMTYAEACARPGVFAKVAPMSGSNLMGCVPKEPVSLMHTHGDPDEVVPYDGRATLSQILASADFPDVPASVAAWAEADGCDPEPRVTETDGGEVVRQRWGGCDRGVTVELVTYPGNGHSWPTSPFDGLDALLRFFDIRG